MFVSCVIIYDVIQCLENQSKLWACVVETAEEVGAAITWRNKLGDYLVKGGDEKQSNYCAAFVGRNVSFMATLRRSTGRLVRFLCQPQPEPRMKRAERDRVSYPGLLHHKVQRAGLKCNTNVGTDSN